MKALSLVLVGCLAAPAIVAAQGSISGQGLGYPGSQLSTRAAATGGALAEIDPLSPQNPAALTGWASGGLFVQSEPEYRTMRLGDASDHTRAVRFPLFATATRIRNRLFLGLSASSLLDQTWGTQEERVQEIGDETVTATGIVRSEGEVTDVQAGAAWAPGSIVRVGVSLHVLSGRTRQATGVSFDAGGFASLVRRSEVTFGGSALSAGLVLTPTSAWLIGVSGGVGGALRIDSGTVEATGDAPDRFGASLAYAGVPGMVVAANIEWTGWSSVANLSANGARNTTAFGVGGEVAGPTVLGKPLTLRAGGRWRDLPFPAAGESTRERVLSLGVGVPLLGSGPQARAAFDLGILRAARSSGADFSESAWILSTGLSIRP
jgi:hypothetical protein